MTTSDKINLGMAIFTAGLFFLTGISTCLTRNAIISSDSTNRQTLNKMQEFADASKNSAASADRSAKEQKTNDSLSRNIDSTHFQKTDENTKQALSFSGKSIESNISSSKKTFELQGKSIDAQVAAMKQTKKDFETETQPFLELKTPLNIDTIGINVPIVVSYKIKNLGKYPVKVIEENSVCIPRYNTPSFDSIYNNKNKIRMTYVNRYITYDSPLEEQSQTPFRLDSAYYNAIRNRRMPIYELGFIKYLNLVTNQTKEYDYMIRITFMSTYITNNEFLVNDNKEIPK